MLSKNIFSLLTTIWMWSIILLSCKRSATSSVRVVNSLFVSRRSPATKESSGGTFIEGPFTIFDEYGSMPSFEDTFKLLQASSPVVVILSTNFTLISYREDNLPGGLRSIIRPRTVIRLTDRLALVVTGLAGDCRKVAQIAKELVANHSFAYGAEPSGYLLASKVAQFLQEATTGSRRPLSCQVFVCSSLASDGADRFILPTPVIQPPELNGINDTTTSNTTTPAIQPPTAASTFKAEPEELVLGHGFSMHRFLLLRRSVFSISPAGSLSLVQAACSGGGGGGGGGSGGVRRWNGKQQPMLQLLEADYRPGMTVAEAGDLARRCMGLARQSQHADSDDSVVTSSSSGVRYLLLSESQS